MTAGRDLIDLGPVDTVEALEAALQRAESVMRDGLAQRRREMAARMLRDGVADMLITSTCALQDVRDQQWLNETLARLRGEMLKD